MTDNATTAFSAALAHHEAGRLDQAQALYRDILADDPDHAESLHLLGLITGPARQPGGGRRHDPAGDRSRARPRTASQQPRRCSPPAWPRRGCGCRVPRRRRAASGLGRNPQQPGDDPARSGPPRRRRSAELPLRRRCAPGSAEIWYNLANALVDMRPAEEAEACFRRAIGLQPDLRQCSRQLRALADDAGALARGGGLAERSGPPRA